MDKKIKVLEEAGYNVKNPDALDFRVMDKQGKPVDISREKMDDFSIEEILEYIEKGL